jgi:serine/threonine protein kinase
MILGAIPYMSPEQGSGQPIDARSDIFSFGIVLYETLGQSHYSGQGPGSDAQYPGFVHYINSLSLRS